MTYLRKLVPSNLSIWVSSQTDYCFPFKFVYFANWFPTKPRFYRTKGSLAASTQIRNAILQKAQSALFDYLQSTRNIEVYASENISRYSPTFLEKLLEKVEIDENVGHSITRYLRYHPINEFEPFFESIGLKPTEFKSLLPRDLIFLSDRDRLLSNYLTLFHYGIEHTKIGKIYKEACQVFEYDHGVLIAKIRAYESLGLNQDLLSKSIACSPYLLTGDAKTEFLSVLEKLKLLGFDQNWIVKQLSEADTIRWTQILNILCIFSKMGMATEQMTKLIKQKPGILFEDSGSNTLRLIGLLSKFGSTKGEIFNVFFQFPKIQIWRFVSNFRCCFMFFMEIDMVAEEIDKLARCHSLLLGSCKLKKTRSLLVNLKAGKERLRDTIQENPEILKKWVLGRAVKSIKVSDNEGKSLVEKTKFLMGLGFEEGSKEMEKALRVFRGRGQELQERFDCLVGAGLDWKDVCRIVSLSPQILNQRKDVIEMKIDFLVRELNYPIMNLMKFPSYLSFKIGRIKTRILMFKWLMNEGLADPELALSTIISCPNGVFVKQYVNRHPDGFKVWEDLQEGLASK